MSATTTLVYQDGTEFELFVSASDLLAHKTQACRDWVRQQVPAPEKPDLSADLSADERKFNLDEYEVEKLRVDFDRQTLASWWALYQCAKRNNAPHTEVGVLEWMETCREKEVDEPVESGEAEEPPSD